MLLSVRVRYAPMLGGGAPHERMAEYAPRLHLFLSHGAGNYVHDPAHPVVVALPPSVLERQRHDPDAWLEVKLPLNVASVDERRTLEDALWQLPGARPHYHELPATLAIGINAYSMTATDAGATCSTPTGNASLLVTELRDATATLSVPLMQLTGDVPLIKGMLEFVAAHLVRDGTRLELSTLRFAPARATDVFPATSLTPAHQRLYEESRAQANVWAAQSLGLFFAVDGVPPPSLTVSVPASTRSIHCPYDLTDNGLVFGSVFAARMPAAPAPLAFFDRAMEAALEEMDARAQHIHLAMDAQAAADDATLLDSSEYVATLLCRVVVRAANYDVYLGDFTNKGGATLLPVVSSQHQKRWLTAQHLPASLKLTTEQMHQICEHYKSARFGSAGDCEDLADAAYVQYWQWRRGDYDDEVARLAVHTGVSSAAELERGARLRLIVRMQHELLRANVYVPKLNLSSVTTAKLEADGRTGLLAQDFEPMAHTYMALEPTLRFVESMRDQPDERTPNLVAHVRESSSYLRAYTVRARDRQRRVKIIEGTARSTPDIVPTDVAYRHRTQAAVAIERQRTRAIMLLAGSLGALVQTEIPLTNIESPPDDTRYASAFYRVLSASYAHAFADTGVLDWASVTERAEGLTHGVSINEYTQGTAWGSVPYNRIDAHKAAVIYSTLAGLEPLPAMHIDAAAAARFERAGPPAVFADFARERAADNLPASISLVRAPGELPLPARAIVLTMRDRDAREATPAALASVAAALRAHSALFSYAHARTRYYSDPLVHGDEESQAPVVQHTLVLGLK